MRILILIVFSAIIFLPLSSKAQKTGALISGAYLLEVCKRGQNGQELVPGGHTACQAYIAGLD